MVCLLEALRIMDTACAKAPVLYMTEVAPTLKTELRLAGFSLAHLL